MSKYGWTKGSGLGASGSGIVNPLRVQVEKQKKKPDSEGGGFVGPGGRGKIVGGKKKGKEEEGGRFGVMSEVVVLRGMLKGLDLEKEVGEGSLMQEIGEECGDKVCFPGFLFVAFWVEADDMNSMGEWKEFLFRKVWPMMRRSLSNLRVSCRLCG